MLLAMARDIRVILVKLADRPDNMRTLAHLPPERQERSPQETLEIYAPLAHRLGIQWIKIELEDLAFSYLYPEVYDQLSADVAKKQAEREQYIQRRRAACSTKKLDEAGPRGRGHRPRRSTSTRSTRR